MNELCRKETGQLKVALAHDWLTGMRGGERVLELLCRAFPQAPINTLIHAPDLVSRLINSHTINASWLQRAPGIKRHYRMFLPLFPAAARSLPAQPADLMISTSHCVAKGMPLRPGARHLCYCFTPMRYAWICPETYFGKNFFSRMLIAPLLAALRRWDLAANAKVNLFVAISQHVRQRIQTHYRRDAKVVYPPVDTDFWTAADDADHRPRKGVEIGAYDLIVSALVPYKRLDIAVRAYARSGFPLRIVGVGSEFDSLRGMAGPNTNFLGWLPDERIRELYRGCRALIFPGEEDFGLVPLEAQACGKPVMAFGSGGALETVRENSTGVFFKAPTPESLLDAVARFEARTWDPAAIRQHAEAFNIPAFTSAFNDCIQECLGQ